MSWGSKPFEKPIMVAQVRDKVLARESVMQMGLCVCRANEINRTVEKRYLMLAFTRDIS